MTKWKRLRRGKSAKHPTFHAQTVVKIASTSNLAHATPDVIEGEAAPSRSDRTLHLTNIDPYGYLLVKRLPGSRPTLGSFLTRNAEKGDILALYSQDIVSADQLHDGRDRRFIVTGNYHDDQQRYCELHADSIKEKR